ncbi:hypothetical protein EDB81DRAFT_777176 [Dactylonectria macrodidyma]|uniref:Secreted protein n=1 Tax=Dactylonectria macrodidyma TaxID=307937 RepID=A0A9P9JPQ8_9HYPO|nr:hypothetical protein EDB81DRAFT_777176 [Dactylonectria macrodidyma]
MWGNQLFPACWVLDVLLAVERHTSEVYRDVTRRYDPHYGRQLSLSPTDDRRPSHEMYDKGTMKDHGRRRPLSMPVPYDARRAPSLRKT